MERLLRPAAFWLLAAGIAASAACTGSPMQPTPPPAGPALSCPVDLDLQSPDDLPVAVVYATPSPTGGVAPVTVSCTPASGTSVPVGSTPVSCVASDALARQAQCSFSVRVRPAPRLTRTRFLAFGDSITYGDESPPVMTFSPGLPNSYPFRLRDMLAARYARQSIVMVNSGWPGEYAAGPNPFAGSPGGQTRLKAELALHQPDVLLLMEGTNDLLVPSNAPLALAALETMIREAKSRGVTVLLATIPPQRGGGFPRDRTATAQAIPGFNDQVRSLAAREGATLVDVFAALAPNLNLYIGVDDLHPTNAGFLKIAETFFDAIRTTLEANAFSAHGQ